MFLLPVSLAVTAVAMFGAARTVARDNARMESSLVGADPVGPGHATADLRGVDGAVPADGQISDHAGLSGHYARLTGGDLPPPAVGDAGVEVAVAIHCNATEIAEPGGQRADNAGGLADAVVSFSRRV